MSDCPHGEDEKKCAALIDDELQAAPEQSSQTYRDFFTKNNEDVLAGEDEELMDSIDRKDVIEEEEYVTTEDDVNGNLTDVVSGREISSSKLKNSLVRSSNAFVPFNDRLDVNNYNDRGYLNVRKNGKWGKLCLDDTDHLLQQRQLSWSVEDLARAVCKAITYQ